jgi:glycerophosphoryl diester phosphodiesterase
MTQVIGHRGIAGLEPENTLRSFRRAIELGVDYVETDVRRTSDGRLVLMHDETVDRTTDGTGKVADLSFDAVRRLDAGRGERAPTLEEFLDLIAGRCKAHIELKTDVGPDVLALVEARGLLPTVVVTDFDTDRLGQLRRLSEDVAIEHVFGEPPPDAVERAVRVRARRVSVHHSHVTAALVAEAHAAGLQITAWTPNTEDAMRAMLDLGVDLICTDRADILLRLLGR